MGVYPRLALSLLAQNKVIWTQDDDWIVPTPVLEGLLNWYAQEPNRVHGIFGRDPRVDNTYAVKYQHEMRECEMVLTSACVFSRWLLPHVWHLIDTPMVKDYQKFAIQHGTIPSNGEDILLSYAAMRFSGYKNMCYGSPITALSKPTSLSDNPGHYVARTELMQRCRQFLCLPDPI
jgi:hypothetical protein